MIVKNLLAVGAIATAASAASAADVSKADWKVNGVVRMDAAQSSTDTKVGSADKVTTKSSQLNLVRAQFGLTGNEGPVGIHMQYNAESNTLWNAYITHKVNDMVTLSFGKLNALSQSWENDYEVQDLYITSMAYDLNTSNTNGAQVTANFGDHQLSLQALQGVGSWSTTDATTNKTTTTTFASKGGLTTTLQYRGEINKMIRPILTYSMVKTAGSKGADGTATGVNYANGYQNQMGAGVQVDTAGAKIDLEYDSVTSLKQKMDTDSPTNKNRTTNSVVAQVRYSVAEFTPFLKVTSDTDKFGLENGINDVTGMNLALGTEYAVAQGLRAHAFYMSKATSTKVSTADNKKVNTTGFNFGVTASL